jgi:hypothetical protein
VRRDRDTATVACNSSGEKWHLACDGQVWIGEYRNCTGENNIYLFRTNLLNRLFWKSIDLSKRMIPTVLRQRSGNSRIMY